MRAAQIDGRPVPAGVNLAPPIRFWSLTLGAEYEPETDAVILPRLTATATSPWMRVDRPTSITIGHEQRVPGSDGYTIRSLRYADAAQVPNGNNGNGQVTSADTWASVSYTIRRAQQPILAEAAWFQYVIWLPTDARSVPGTLVRAPSVTIGR